MVPSPSSYPTELLFHHFRLHSFQVETWYTLNNSGDTRRNSVGMGDCIPGKPCPAPPPVPHHLTGPNSEELAKHDEALKRAQTLLQDAECNKAVSSSTYDAKQSLNVVGFKLLPQYKTEYNGWVNRPRLVGTAGEIELYFSFFQDTIVSQVGNKTSTELLTSPVDRRALTILHELAHVTRRYVHKHDFRAVNQLTPILFDETQSNNVVNQRIYNACFKPKQQ